MSHVWTAMDVSGRVVVPKDMRQALGLEGGGELMLSVRDGALICMTRAEALRRARAMVTPWQAGDPLPSEELIAERRAAARAE